jgi:hypothetical protein
VGYVETDYRRQRYPPRSAAHHDRRGRSNQRTRRITHIKNGF